MKVYDGSKSGQGQDAQPERMKVGIAEYGVANEGVALTTSGLGSCVGVALYDTETETTGLVHVLLPSADEMEAGKAAKFADSGTELLIEKMVEVGADANSLIAKIAGGSDMLDFSEGGSGIGDRNVKNVKRTLKAHQIPVFAEDVGGDHGRALRLEPNGDLIVKSANQEDHRL